MNTATFILEIILLAVTGAATGYLAVLSVMAFFARRMDGPAGASERRFAVIIPAHNEEHTIAGTLESCLKIDYPADRFDVVVVADNCTDGTANVSRSLGAKVLERTDAVNRGKGHALRWAFETLGTHEPAYGAFIVIDADSVATPNFLKVMNAYLDGGARAVQSADLVTENRRSWSTEVTRLGFTLYNHVRPLGRKVLGFSAGLRGNGMCFDARLLERVPWNAFGVTEDLQYGLTLLLNGETVRYAPEAVVYATMPAEVKNAVSQRVRWEKGRGPVKKKFSRPLLARALRGPSLAALDAWMDLVTPPFVHLMGAVTGLLAIHALLAAVAPGAVSAYLPAWIAVFAAGMAHVFLGLAAARADAGQYAALFYVPLYACWKVLTLFFKTGPKPPEEWVRTTRENRSTPAQAGQRERSQKHSTFS